jgi:hypothetical protein
VTSFAILRQSLRFGAAAAIVSAAGLFAAPAAQALTVGDLKVPGFSYTVTDKTFSNFTGITGFADTDDVTIGLASGVHRMTILGAWTTPVAMQFDVSVSSGTDKIDMFSANYQSSSLPTAGTGNFTYTASAPNSVVGSPTVNSPALVGTFTSPVTSSTFSTTLTPTSGVIDQFSGRLLQVSMPMSNVPGPLPVLGAGVAFGLSRKLRRRIKLSA